MRSLARFVQRNGCLVGLIMAFGIPAAADDSRVPRWDARGVGPLPWQGIACLNTNADGSRIVVGTIAPPGDPNVHVLDGQGQIVASYRVGQRWIEQVVAQADERCFALCTMTTGASGDEPQVYLCASKVVPINSSSGGTSLFHYGEHSNHIGKRLVAYRGGAVTVNQEQLLWLTTGADAAGGAASEDKSVPFAKSPVRNLKATSLAVHPSGIAVVGGYFDGDPLTKEPHNLFVFRPGESKPLWSRAVMSEVGASNPPEPGEYGRPIHANGRREPLRQRDEPTFAPLSLAVTREPEFTAATRIATADYPGWQRWIRSSGSGKDEHYGARFMPAKPAVTVYDDTGKVIRRFDPDKFTHPGWVDLTFLPGGQKVLASPHRWTSRGLAGQPTLPVDDHATTLWLLDTDSGGVRSREFPDAIASAVISDQGTIVVSCWNGMIYRFSESTLVDGPLPTGFNVGGPAIVDVSPQDRRIIAATNGGEIIFLSATGQAMQRIDLSRVIPRIEKPWVKNAKATSIVKRLWQLPGGRVESDLGGQRAIEAPEGLILIEAHAGLSFESEWAGLEAAGLDPRRVKYVLTTHEHGDHSPGAYLWRVATGAEFICSREMAYVLQHHLPIGTGYGFHPPVPTDIRLDEDAELKLAGMTVGALRLSGHTFGSMGWLFERDGKRFVAIGDLIMPDGALGYAGSINFSPQQVLESLRKLDELKVDLVLPGHGPIVGPERYVGAGIAVGRHVGWGKMPPESPNPRFRLTQSNVLVAGFLSEATSADFGDLDGDGSPDAAFVSPRENGSVVKLFLNRSDRENRFDSMKADFETAVPSVASPTKLRLRFLNDDRKADIFVAGSSMTAILLSKGKTGDYDIQLAPGQEIHQLRLLDASSGKPKPVLLGRFSGSQVVDLDSEKGPRTTPLVPQIQAPYLDIREQDLNGDGRTDWIANNGKIWLRGTDGRIAESPSVELTLPVPGAWCYAGIGDFNGDRQPDVAFVSFGSDQRHVITVYSNTGDRQNPFPQKPALILDTKAPFTHVRDAPMVADWNADGIDDLIVGLGQDKQVRIMIGDQKGLSADRVELISLEYRLHYEHGLTIADFNADGRPDLACFGDTPTGVGAGGPPAGYIWLQPRKSP